MFAISSSLVDTDGSESLTIVISDIPEGAALTDGVNGYVASTGNTSVDVSTWSLTSLRITPPAHSDQDFTLTVSASATEAANSDTAVDADTIIVQVAAVADQPTLTVPSTITVTEDAQTALFAISTALSDPDGSESLSVEISDLPVGTTLTDGVNTFVSAAGSNSVDITGWDLSGLAITPATDSDQNFVLTVTATATEAADGDQWANIDFISVVVHAAADQPSLTVSSTIAMGEDTQERELQRPFIAG